MASTAQHNNEYVFTVEGHTIEVEFKDIKGEHMITVADYIRKDEYGRAKILLLGAAIESLTDDGKPVIRKSTRTERRSGQRISDDDGIPDLYDEIAKEELVDKLMRVVVQRKPSLAVRDPYRDICEQYADEDAPKQDPTKLRDATKKVS